MSIHYKNFFAAAGICDSLKQRKTSVELMSTLKIEKHEPSISHTTLKWPKKDMPKVLLSMFISSEHLYR
jgi:hypothetical protein